MSNGISNKMIDEAKQLVQENRVLSIVKYPTSTVWFSEILDHNQLFSVYLDATSTGKDICDCQYSKEHGYCKHILAAELYLNMQGYERSVSHQLKHQVVDTAARLNRLSKSLYTQTKKMEIDTSFIKVEVTLNMTTQWRDRRLLISLKIGKQKLYVVKSIPELIYTYFERRTYTLGSKDAIDWQDYAVDQQTHHLFVFLKKVFSYSEPDVYVPSLKYLQIHPLVVAECLEITSHLKNVIFVLNDHVVETYHYSEEKAPLHFYVNKHRLGLECSLEHPHLLDILDDFMLLRIETHFYKIDKDLLPIYELLLDIFDSRKIKPILIKTENISDFINYTIPLLEQITHIHYDGSYIVKKQTYRPDLYVTKEDDTLWIDIQTNTDVFDQYNVEDAIRLENKLLTLGFSKKGERFEKYLHSTDTFYDFLSREKTQLNDFSHVILSEDLQDKAFQVDIPMIRFDTQGSLLDISFNIDGISDKDISKILQHIQENDHYYQLDNGQFIDLRDDVFQDVHHILNQLRSKDVLKDGHIQLHQTQALHLVSDLHKNINMDDYFSNLVYDLTHPELFRASIPKSLKTTLKDYQVYGFKWLKMLSAHQFGGILADDMGLGKTIQTIAYLLSEIEEQKTNNRPNLIVCPASLVYNWKHEFDTFAPNLSVEIVNGLKQDRLDNLKKDVQIYITSYQSFRQDERSYKEKQWHAIVLDESQMVKNYTTKLHRSLRHLSAHVIFALSGTPIENRKEDFWSIFSLILPGLFPHVRDYKKLDTKTIAKMAKPFLLRRLKSDVLTELPEKIETVLYNELSKEQKALYLGYLQNIQTRVAHYSSEEFTKNKLEILSGLTRLRQICCHPKLIMDDYVGDVGKLEQFLTLVETAIAGGHRLLVFSQFTSMLAILQDALKNMGHDSFMLTGQTNTKQRMDMVKAFNAGKHDVFFISLRAGGTGLNLTSADTIILYDLWWNPAVEEQAMGRSHRIGQKKTVQVYRLISQGTIEDKMNDMQQQKKAIFDEVVNDVMMRHELTNDDIKDILGIE
ncbi:SNF2 helicase associated domain-containing protein [Carnobacteriaceae bacterium zg-84]|uniref:SNF2-related protein n=1 Tax=Granulicatella sp. zg-84 TaxID=2678503 RepID=UPI0013C1A59E|nr:SNF2-related protein [Granulicatella sp. zg-84]NEW65465.1 hypothetical protein [Granulicatella sp. zg-84]QMI85259.1 SNF2 helicase associated domain-containing protein [Carnobacteriaceae bacterium zg-84]